MLHKICDVIYNVMMQGRQKSRNIVVGKSYAKKLLRFLLIVTTLLLLAHLLMQFLNMNVFHQQNGQIYELSNRFDLDDEASVQTWFTQALFLAISGLAALSAYLQAAKPERRLWTVISIIGLVISVDEIAGLHERVLQSIHVLFFYDSAPIGFANAWLLILPFVILGMCWLGWAVYRILPRHISLLFILCGVTYLSGAMFLDLFISVTPRENFLNQGVLVAVEESLEIISVVIALYAIADYLERYHYNTINSALKKLKPEYK